MAVRKSLLDLTNAYLSLEALLKSKYLSKRTREQIEKTMRTISKEAVKEMELQQQDNSSSSAAAD